MPSSSAPRNSASGAPAAACFCHQRRFLLAAQALNVGQRPFLPVRRVGLLAQGGDVLQDPLRVQGFDRLAQAGRAVEQFVEMLLGDFQQFDLGEGDHGGGARFAGQQGHFAERLAFRQPGDEGRFGGGFARIAGEHGDLAGDDQVQRVAGFAPVEDRGSRGKLRRLDAQQHFLHLLGRQRAQQVYSRQPRQQGRRLFPLLAQQVEFGERGVAQGGAIPFQSAVAQVVQHPAQHEARRHPQPTGEAAQAIFRHQPLRALERQLQRQRLNQGAGAERHDDGVGSLRRLAVQADDDPGQQREHGQRGQQYGANNSGGVERHWVWTLTRYGLGQRDDVEQDGEEVEDAAG